MRQFRLYRERDFGQVISDTIDFTKLHFKLILKGFAVLILPFALVIGALFGIIFKDIGSLSQEMGSVIATQGDPSVFIEKYIAFLMNPALYFVIFLSIVVYIFSLVFVLGIFKEYEKNPENVEFKAVMKTVWKYCFPVLGLTIIIQLISGVGFMLCIIPGIILSIFFTLAISTHILEGTSIFDSLSRSLKLVKGNWWKTFLLVIVVYLISAVVTSVVSTPLTMATVVPEMMDVMNSGDDYIPYQNTSSLTFAVIQAISMAWGQLVSMCATVFIGILFYSYKEQKERIGVKEELENLGNL